MGESPKEQRYNENALFENNREDLIDMSDERTAAIVRAYIQNLQFTYGEYSMALARCIQNNYLKAGRHSRGIKPQLLRVLYATDMPGVLTEIGFMSNAQEMAYMKSEKGQDEIARSIYEGVRDYSAYVLETRRAEEEAAAAPKPGKEPETQVVIGKEPVRPAKQDKASDAPAAKAATPEKGEPEKAAGKSGAQKPAKAGDAPKQAARPLRYTVQVLASAQTVPTSSARFKSYRNKVKQYTAEGRFRYKYCVGEYDTRAAAQKRLAEVRKIGIFAVAMIGVAWAGIRFLKGFDIFSRNVEYYAAYDQINGVQNASPIMMKGVKIGSVTRLSFDPARSDKVVLQFTIKRQYRIPTDSEAKIFSNGLMGAKAIEITYGTADTYLQKGDTLRSSRDRDLMDMAGSELDFFKQKVSQLTTDLSRTLENLNGLMETNADNIAGTLGNLNSVTGDMAEILSAEKNSLKSALDNLSKFSDMLGENAGRVDSIIGDVDRFTSQLTEEQFARKLSQAVEHLDGLVARIAQGEGTVGKLISAPELYDSLEKASDNLAALLADVKQYPGRYVHLSLFGRNPEKMKERADRKAAKVAAKAERDSLRRLQ